MIEILPDSDPVMRKTSRRVTHVDEDMRQLIADMYDTMVAQWGIGLAAIQVGLPKRFFIYEIPERIIRDFEACYDPDSPDDNNGTDRPESSMNPDGESEPGQPVTEDSETDGEPIIEPGYTGDYVVCINPRIVSKEGEQIDDEGCLSKEGWLAKVKRAIKVTFQAYDLDMQKFEKTVEGMEARCVQHEIDHLDGILFTDRAESDTLREITDEDFEGEEKESEPEAEDGNGSVEMEDEKLETTITESA